jgi:holo-[acyl-carrier protein] synthase
MLAVGIDIIELSRIASVLERWGDRFLSRVYTVEEIAFSRGRVPQLAGRFAAKEATMKALGTGRRGVSWHEVEVTREPGSPPAILLHGRAQAKADQLGISNITITISHSRDYAIALVIGE